MSRRSARSLLGWLAVSFVPAIVGAPFPAPAWYRRLRKPAWSPPAWIFGPAWTLLYLAWVSFAAALNAAIWRRN